MSAEAQAAIRQRFAEFGPVGETLYRTFLGAVHQALTIAMRELYIFAFAFAVLAFLTTFFLREVPLKRDEFFREEAKSPEAPLGREAGERLPDPTR